MSNVGHNSNVYVDIGRLSQPDRELLSGAIKELSDSYARTEAERELQREILNKMNESMAISKKLLRAVSRTYHKNNHGEVKEFNQNYEEMYTVLVGGD